MDDKWMKLKPYIMNMVGTLSNDVIIEVHAPVRLLYEVGGFYRFELIDWIYPSHQAYACAFFSVDEAQFKEIRALESQTK